MNLKLWTLGFISIAFVVLNAGASETAKGMQKDMDAFKKEMNEKIVSLEQQISELKEKAKTKKDAAKDKTIHELEEGRDKFKAELNGLKNDSEQKWKQVKKDIGSSFDNLNAKIQKALKD